MSLTGEWVFCSGQTKKRKRSGNFCQLLAEIKIDFTEIPMKNVSFSTLLALIIIFTLVAHNPWAMALQEEADPAKAYTQLKDNMEIEEFYTNLGLRSAYIKEGNNFSKSSKQGVIWTKHADGSYPKSNVKESQSYSLSKFNLELKKYGITSGTGGASYLGIGLDIEFESKEAMLSFKREIEVHLLTTYKVAVYELSIPTDHIKSSSDFEKKIKKVLKGEPNINSYKDLMGIFRDYGFCVPTKFVLGGQISSESTQTVASIKEAKKNQKSLSIEAQVPLGNASGKAGVKTEKRKSTKSKRISVFHSSEKCVEGGNICLKDDPKEWEKMLLFQIKQWRVIEVGSFFPITDFLGTKTKKKCLSLIDTFCKDTPLSLERMQFAINNNFSLLDALLEDISTGRLVIGTKNSHRWGTVCKRNKPVSACYLQKIDGPAGKVNIKERIKRWQELKALKAAKEKGYFLSLPLINALFEDLSEGKLVIGTEKSHEWGTVHYKNHEPISICYLQKIDGPAGKMRTKDKKNRIKRLKSLKSLEAVKLEIERCEGLGESYLDKEKYSAIWNANT